MRAHVQFTAFGVLLLLLCGGTSLAAQSGTVNIGRPNQPVNVPAPADTQAPAAQTAPAAPAPEPKPKPIPVLPRPSAADDQPGATQDAANELSVAVGKSVLIDFARPVARVAVGLGEFAEASVISPTELMVNGKTAGETTLIVWDFQGGRQFFNVSVRASESASNVLLDGIRRELRAELPGQAIKVSAENGAIFLRGTVKDLTASNRAIQIAQTAGKVTNLLNVQVPEAEPQILLKVRFASVDRNKERELGMNIINTGAWNTPGVVSTGQFGSPSVTSASGAVTAAMSSGMNLTALAIGASGLAVEIKAMEQKGLVEVLAEPNLLATNGKQASFLAGGEYPYPVVQGGSGGSGSSVSIQFKEYGVRLNFIPTITPRGTIKLQVAPEVSSLDFTSAVTISGFTVPAVATRKVNTQVELSDGQSFVLGGLLDNRETETLSKIPFLGDVPVLGRFFRSISKNRTNTELIVIVTPVIVSPIEAGAALPELNYPEKFLPSNSSVPMHNPDAKSAANTLPPPAKTMPVEKLVESMKSEKQLVVGAAGTTFGAATAAATGTGTGTTSSSTGP